MQLFRKDNLSATRPPEDSFTGDVYIHDYFQRAAPSKLVGAIATFAPGARTPWKVNPLGQTVVVTNGTGWAQCEDEEIIEIRVSDLVWFPPGEPHWEGVPSEQAMSYVVLQESVIIEFRKKVTDEEYQRGPTRR